MDCDAATRNESPRPVAIAVAPNGGRRAKADHPALPMTAAELAATASACVAAGAAMIHLHVRDRAGRHVLDAEANRAAMTAIQAAVGEALVVQMTTESLGLYRPAQQMAAVKEVRPEAVSLALRELAAGAADERELAALLQWLQRERICPQMILYAPEEALRLAELQRRGLIPFDEVPVLYVLGRYAAGQISRPADLLPFLAPDVPRFAQWMTCAFGRHEAACVTMAGLLGGDARVGFENNLWLPSGATADDNAALVRATAEALTGLGCAIAGAADLRARWGLRGAR